MKKAPTAAPSCRLCTRGLACFQRTEQLLERLVAKQHPLVHSLVPGTQLDFAGGTNFRELGGYEADEGKHVRWGQIYRGIPTGLLTSDADRKLLDSLGLRLILDLRSEQEAEKMPDYVPDGARLVRICGLCLDGGKEVDFSPEDREKLLEGKPDLADLAVDFFG